MPRQTYAAQTLASEVKALRSRAKPKPVGDPDGLNVYRAMAFDKPTSKWLHPILEAADDDRIAGLDFDGGVLTVHFGTGPGADSREPFDLQALSAILSA